MIFQNIQYVMQTVNEFERSCFNLSSIRKGNLNISTFRIWDKLTPKKWFFSKKKAIFQPSVHKAGPLERC